MNYPVVQFFAGIPAFRRGNNVYFEPAAKEMETRSACRRSLKSRNVLQLAYFDGKNFIY